MKLGMSVLGALLSTVCANAEIIEKCGVYNAEGYMSRDKVHPEKMILVVEKGTDTEITFDLGRYAEKTFKDYLGTNVNLEIQIRQSCLYQCKARVIKIHHALEPYEKPKPFLFPGFAPAKKLPCSPTRRG